MALTDYSNRLFQDMVTGCPAPTTKLHDHILDSQTYMARQMLASPPTTHRSLLEHVEHLQQTMSQSPQPSAELGVSSEVVSRPKVHVPTPKEAFSVTLAVTAELSKAGIERRQVTVKVVDEVIKARNRKKMVADDLLVVYVRLDSIGLAVRVITDAQFGEVVVEAKDTDAMELGQKIYEDVTHEYFEARKAAVRKP